MHAQKAGAEIIEIANNQKKYINFDYIRCQA